MIDDSAKNLKRFIRESLYQIDESYTPSVKMGARTDREIWKLDQPLPGWRKLFGEPAAEGVLGLFVGQSVPDLFSSLVGPRGLFSFGPLRRAAGSSKKGQQLASSLESGLSDGSASHDVGDLFPRTASVSSSRLPVTECQSRMLESLAIEEEEKAEAVVEEFHSKDLTAAYISDLSDIIGFHGGLRNSDPATQVDFLFKTINPTLMSARESAVSQIQDLGQSTDPADQEAYQRITSVLSNIFIPNLFANILRLVNAHLTSKFPSLPLDNLTQDALMKL